MVWWLPQNKFMDMCDEKSHSSKELRKLIFQSLFYIDFVLLHNIQTDRPRIQFILFVINWCCEKDIKSLNFIIHSKYNGSINQISATLMSTLITLIIINGS